MLKKSFFCVLFYSFCVLNFSFAQNTPSENQSELTNISNSTVSTPASNIAFEDGQFTPNANEQVPIDDDGESGVWVFIKMVFVLAIIVLIIYLIAKFFKKVSGIDNRDDPFLRVVSEVKLSPSKSVNIVTLLDKAYIIGVTEQNINLIGQVEDPELVNSMNVYSDQKNKTVKPRSFGDILNIFMPGSTNDKTVFSNDENNSRDFFENQRARLNEDEQGEQ